MFLLFFFFYRFRHWSPGVPMNEMIPKLALIIRTWILVVCLLFHINGHFYDSLSASYISPFVIIFCKVFFWRNLSVKNLKTDVTSLLILFFVKDFFKTFLQKDDNKWAIEFQFCPFSISISMSKNSNPVVFINKNPTNSSKLFSRIKTLYNS